MNSTLSLLLCVAAAAADDSPIQILARPMHLRSGIEREWSDFPETAEGDRLQITFSAHSRAAESALVLRQQDIKQGWQVSLNGRKLGELIRDENDQWVTLAVPAGVLVDGENSLLITSRPPSDDVRVGPITLHARPVHEVLHESTLTVQVVDEDTHQPLPCRITIVDAQGSLPRLGATSEDDHAVRAGVIYAARGTAACGLPAGKYTVFAGRGFEYSLARTEITVNAGETRPCQLAIRRTVPTPGYVACDTHIHTLTHSGHGDCTLDERLLTLAGEGIELPIATDHNRHIDYEPAARRLGVRSYFTPVIGNEVTTSRGHFNMFPVAAGAAVPDHTLTEWGAIFDAIDRTPGVKVAILNHARDIHSGVRPFGPALHNAVIGENLEGWPMRFNGMEVVNSGATQNDPLRLVHDWMALLNHGYQVTPVGSSDSHDVSRYIVGQGRTYIRCNDRDPGELDVDEAVNSFRQGRVMVSYGLLAELTVNEKYRSGELARVTDDSIRVQVRVLGPEWVHAKRVLLFSNGELVREVTLDADSERGVQWMGNWTLPRPRHDVHLVAVAIGSGVNGLYWRTAKPYQPTSPDWLPYTLGCSGAVWVDADEDGRATPARDYAAREVAKRSSDLAKLIEHLSDYDAAVAAQAAHLFLLAHPELSPEELQQRLRNANPAVRSGFESYLVARRENQLARGK